MDEDSSVEDITKKASVDFSSYGWGLETQIVTSSTESQIQLVFL